VSYAPRANNVYIEFNSFSAYFKIQKLLEGNQPTPNARRFPEHVQLKNFES